MYSSYSISGDFCYNNIHENFDNYMAGTAVSEVVSDAGAVSGTLGTAVVDKPRIDTNIAVEITQDIIEFELQNVHNKEYGQAKEYYAKLESTSNMVQSYIKDIDVFYANISDLNNNNNIAFSNLSNLTSAVNSINILFNYSYSINYLISNNVLNINNLYTTATNNLLILGKTLSPQTSNLVVKNNINNILTPITPIIESINNMKIYVNNKLVSATKLYDARVNSICSPGNYSVTDTKCCPNNTIYNNNSCNSCSGNNIYDSVNNICNIKSDYLTTSSRITTNIDSKPASKTSLGLGKNKISTYTCNNSSYPILSSTSGSNICYSMSCPGCTISNCPDYVKSSNNTCIACPPGYSYNTNKTTCNLINNTTFTLPTMSSLINKSGL